MNNSKFKNAFLFVSLVSILFACNPETEESTPDPDKEQKEKPFVEIPDSNFEKRLLAQGIDTDGELNQQIWLEDALKVTSLDLFSPSDTDASEKISDLTGIASFKNLTELIAGNNALVAISLSENTVLENLQLSFNHLQEIDLSANIALTTLSIGRNELDEIDLSANVNLQYLNLEANNLETLDISTNIALIDLKVIVNNISSIIGLEQTTKLKTLNLAWNHLEELSLNLPALEGLNIEHNFIKSLTIDGCTSLEYLLATQNKLQSIDIGTNKALKHLKVSYNEINSLLLTYAPNLEVIWISGNQLSDLDVSQLPKLYDLRIIRNQNLTCIKFDSEQDIATIQKENYQSLTTGSCD